MEYDTTKMTVADIREELVSLGFPEETAYEIKGKAALVSTLKELLEEGEEAEITEEDDGDILNLTEDFVDDQLSDLSQEEELDPDDIPDQSDPRWTDYVLSLLDEDEVFKKKPTVDGLRRVMPLVMGEILESDSEVIQVPEPGNEKRATVKVGIRIQCFDTSQRYCSAVADSYLANTDDDFKQYPVAVAESRAEGRALRRLLRLKKVITAEEGSSDAAPDPSLTSGTPDRIAAHQIKFIENMCQERCDINLVALVQSQFPEITNIRKMSYKDAQELCQLLNKYATSEQGAPEALKGFDPNWKSVLDKGD